MFSTRFMSVATTAGWDEEAILMASLVEDTPDQDIKHKKRSHFPSKTPPLLTSRTKRRAHRRSPASIPVHVLNLEEEEEEEEGTAKEECRKNKAGVKIDANEGKKKGYEMAAQETGVSSSDSALPCMDRLREELSCAICLEICFEPSTTSCGHSFCKKCLQSAADKCGKRCPKCRQLISYGRSGTVNTVLWNTIQLLFPEEVRARNTAVALNGREACCSLEKVCYNSGQIRDRSSSGRGDVGVRRRGDIGSRRKRGVVVPSQDEDAALALRLQRKEYMEAFRGTATEQGRSSSLSWARANLKAMATRAISLRTSRGRPI